MSVQVDRPNWWNWLAPNLVVMVTTYDVDKEEYRCSPFSWVVPLSKKPELFGILARRSSKTLSNIRKLIDSVGSARFTVSLMEPTPDVAQEILETRSGEPGSEMKLVVSYSDGCGVLMVPEGSLASLCAVCDSILSLPGTHDMIVSRVSGVAGNGRFGSPLLFYFGRKFAYARVFEVEGY